MFDYVTPYAGDHCIQVIDANELIAALDGSVDFLDGSDLDGLLATKYDDCSEMFMIDVDCMGIERPVCVEIDEDGFWIMGDGHHRLAVASRHGFEIMVLFATDGNYMQTGICSDPDDARLAGKEYEDEFGEELAVA